ncbi:unnamed protein product [Thelazia callipaeda]|uniref:Uncharacterized protein n=1 Tax=Thelazia callipaeda TaxID=103827 RepID=A0A0N5CTM7_THECL|nr:unnamed protein product [Thelazia callipaeda]
MTVSHKNNYKSIHYKKQYFCGGMNKGFVLLIQSSKESLQE